MWTAQEPRVGCHCLAAGAPGESGWPRCIPTSPGPAPEPPQGEARCPYSAPSALNSPPCHPQVQRKTLLPGPPALGGEGGAMAGLLICPFPVTTQHPFLDPSLCFLNTLNSEPEHLSLKPRRGGSRETLRDLQSEGASSEEGCISGAIRKLLGVICSQLAGGETKPAEQTQVGEGRAGRGAEQGCFGCAKVHRGKHPTHTLTHTRLTERRNS